MTTFDLLKKASEEGLQIITVTDGANGYPTGLHDAVIGFETYAELEAFFEECGVKFYFGTGFKKRDGWSFWQNEGSELREYTHYLDENEEECEEVMQYSEDVWSHAIGFDIRDFYYLDDKDEDEE